MDNKLKELYDNDNTNAYKTLLELEDICTKSNALYPYFDVLLDMLSNEKSVVRVRGFRLICCLSIWDKENKINKNIDLILSELDDKTSTSVRQCLKNLNLILINKSELTDIIKNKLENMNLYQYKESMQSLIKKDIKLLLDN